MQVSPLWQRLRAIFQNYNFRLFWIGQGASLLGDQFYLIALPWLVLQETGDSLALAGVLAVAGAPRAIFMLFGGVFSDRFSPRRVMLFCDLGRMVLVLLLALGVLFNTLQLWMLYLFSLLFGMLSGLFSPAANTTLPRLLHPDALQTGNSLYEGSARLAAIVGPVLAGGLIASLVNPSQAGPGLAGISAAFGLDALTFLISIGTLWKMRLPGPSPLQGSPDLGLYAAIRTGFLFLWQDIHLRAIFLVIATMNFLFNGPAVVGVPVFVSQRLQESAASYGLIVSVYAGGSLLGILLSGSLPRPTAKRMGRLIFILMVFYGLFMLQFGFVSTTAWAATSMICMGTINGYLSVTLFTWIQRRTPGVFLGRVMSWVTFSNLGLAPISQALSGLVIKLSIPALFAGAGMLMLLTAALFALSTNLDALGSALASSNHEA